MKKLQRIQLGYGKGSVEELPSGGWRWGGPIAGVRERLPVVKSMEAAIAAGKEAQARGVKPTGKTLRELFDEWLRSRNVPGARVRTVKGDGYAASKVCQFIGDVPLDKLTVKVVVQGLYEPLVAAGQKKSTIDNYRSRLRMACEYAVDMGDMEVNPVLRAKLPPIRQAPREKKHYRPDEVEVVRDFLIGRHAIGDALFLTMLMCGLRPEEARGLLWKNAPFEEGYLDVKTSADPDGTIVEILKTDIKTKAAHRRVPMPSVLIAALRREQIDQLARVGRKPYVFADANGNVFVERRLGELAHKISEGADVRHVPPNGYRHTYASMLMDSRTLSPKDIMALCGWTTMAMLDNYTHSVVDVPDAVTALATSMGRRRS